MQIIRLNENFRMVGVASRANQELGYEPAGLTMYPPPPQNDRGLVNFFRIGV